MLFVNIAKRYVRNEGVMWVLGSAMLFYVFRRGVFALSE